MNNIENIFNNSYYLEEGISLEEAIQSGAVSLSVLFEINLGNIICIIINLLLLGLIIYKAINLDKKKYLIIITCLINLIFCFMEILSYDGLNYFFSVSASIYLNLISSRYIVPILFNLIILGYIKHKIKKNKEGKQKCQE